VEDISNFNQYIIAEVGQNHQGSQKLALEYIETFSKLGASAIKFQTRDVDSLFDKESLNRKYYSNNAFADTYGEHRKKLEIDHGFYDELIKTCKNNKTDFISTPFDIPSLEFLLKKGVNKLKISSFDCGFLKLIDAMAEANVWTIMSCGGASLDHIKASVNCFLKKSRKLILLYCVSEYPTPIDKLKLGNIKTLIKEFPDVRVGLSDHFNGILTGPLAAMLGATVFEKHVTFDRAWKGTDHVFALEPEGFRKFCRDIRRTHHIIDSGFREDLGKEPVFNKLGKSIIFEKDLDAGHILEVNNLDGKILNDHGVPIRDTYKYIGKKLLISVKNQQALSDDMFD
jgi:N-acetylneuraminate synthase/sialic acid synthase